MELRQNLLFGAPSVLPPFPPPIQCLPECQVKLASQHKTRQDSRAAIARRIGEIVGSCAVREMSWTASCWFALACADEAMMLSQLTFHKSESLTKAGTAREETA